MLPFPKARSQDFTLGATNQGAEWREEWGGLPPTGEGIPLPSRLGVSVTLLNDVQSLESHLFI